MSKVSEKQVIGIGCLLSLSIFYGEIAGIIHSAKHHSTGDIICCVCLPPWAWYRSIEMYWHDDFANVNWDKRLESDMKTCIYFINEVTKKEANVYQINEDADKFSTKINRYPKEKKLFLMEGYRTYIAYSKGLMDDLVAPMEKFYSTGKIVFTLSQASNKLRTELVNTYKLKTEIEYSEKAVDELWKLVNEKIILPKSENEISELKSKFKSAMTLMKTKFDNDYKRIFKIIFNEEL